MEAPATISIRDPLAIVRQLDAEQIRNRIADLERERGALFVLLRAALTAERKAAKNGVVRA